jgi:hypothetical protein
MVRTGRLSSGVMRTGLSPVQNAIVVQLSADADRTETAAVIRLAHSVKVDVEVRRVNPERLRFDTDSCDVENRVCDLPLRGGTYIGSGDTYCSTAFRALGNNGRRYVLTAGHCIKEPSDPSPHWFWDTYDSIYSGDHIHSIGVAEQWHYPGNDWAKIDATGQWPDTASWPAQVAFWGHGSGYPWPQSLNYPIYGEEQAFVGQMACHAGANTGGTCATVQKTEDETVEYGNDYLHDLMALRGKNLCIWGGDSGGPVYTASANMALGIISGGGEWAECYEAGKGDPEALFANIQEATAELGVKIAPLTALASQTTLNISRPSEHVVRASGTVKHDSVPIQANQVNVNFYRNENGQWALRNSVQAPVNNGSYQAPDVSISEGSWRITTTFPGNEMFSASDSNTITIAPPTVETKPASSIQENQATLNGTVNPNGKETTYRFEYGKTTSYGNSIPVPDGGAGAGTSAVNVYLTPNTLLTRTRYHFRLVATNSDGTSYGSDQAFTTGVKWYLRNANTTGSTQVAFWFGLPYETRVSGDWDGNGVDTPGVFNPSTGVWKLRNSNTTGAAFTTFQYGGGPWTKPVVGDWNNDGIDTIGVYDPVAGNWNLRDSNSAGPPDKSFQYGGGVWETPVAGDWNGIAGDTIGVYDRETSNWNLKNCLCSGPPDYSFQYGGSVWTGGISGDWNGDGTDTIGVYDPVAGNWNLRDSNSAGPPTYSLQFGGSQFQFAVGDWDGNGTDTPGLSEANAPTAIEYQLRNANSSGPTEISFESGTPDQEPLAGDWNADGITTTGRYEPLTGIWRLRPNNLAGIYAATEFQYGGSQFKPVVGDWNGDKTETIGVFEPISGQWYLRNTNSAGPADYSFQYGGSQFKPVVGDWNGDGKDTIGVFEPISGQWYLRNTNSAGPADYSFQYGGSQFKPVVGDWNGDGKDTIGLYEPIAGQWYLRNTNSAGPSDYGFQYGGSQFKPVVGDWNGDKSDTIGLVTW